MRTPRIRSVVCIVISVMAGAPAICSAEPTVVLDQSFAPPQFNENLGAILAEGFAYTAQTITPSLSGELVRAELWFGRSGSNIPWEVSVNRVVNGLPSGQVLAIETIPASQVPVGGPFTIVDFDPALSISAGEQFAFVVHLQGTINNPGLNAGMWTGNANNAYPAGQSAHSQNGSSYQSSGAGADLFFKTYVLIPEPASLIFAIAFLFGRRVRRRCPVG